MNQVPVGVRHESVVDVLLREGITHVNRHPARRGEVPLQPLDMAGTRLGITLAPRLGTVDAPLLRTACRENARGGPAVVGDVLIRSRDRKQGVPHHVTRVHHRLPQVHSVLGHERSPPFVE